MMILIILFVLVLLLVHNSTFRKFAVSNNKQFFYNISYKRDHGIDSAITKYINHGPLKILNFGCGFNTFTDKLINKYSHDVSPVDIVDMGIGNSQVYVYDGVNIPLHKSGSKYDFAIVSTVLHHIPKNKQLEILKSIKNVSNNIIIVEDYVKENSIYSFIKTCLICGLTNLSLLDHPFAFRTRTEWLELFEKLDPVNIIYEHGLYEVYVLNFTIQSS
jgi:hypothetical protein